MKKLKEIKKKVKRKATNQQPPEKANHFPKLPPTQNFEVNLLNLHPSSHAQPPSKKPTSSPNKRLQNFQRPIFQSDSVSSVTKRPLEGFP